MTHRKMQGTIWFKVGIFTELQIKFCFFDFNIRLNWGTYEGFTTPMKDINKDYVKTPTEYFDDESFWNK